MIFFVIICSLMHAAMSQFQTLPTSQQQPLISKLLYPAAPLHYVNIGPELAGDYQFGYDTGKGPLGQSFREEMRLVDGTIKGSYGVIDENGHKRVVHYSAGKSGFIAEEDTNPNSAFSTIQRQPKMLRPEARKPFPEKLSVFKPTNYLQSRNTRPLLTVPVAGKVDAKPAAAAEKVDTSVEPFNRLSTSLQPTSIVVPIYRSPARITAEQAATPLVRGQNIRMSQEQLEELSRIGASAEVYKAMKRATKKPVIRRKLKKVRKLTEEQTYEPRIEDEYYDSAPAFIDIERLSYNIGAERS